jgi:hypothetical protein
VYILAAVLPVDERHFGATWKGRDGLRGGGMAGACACCASRSCEWPSNNPVPTIPRKCLREPNIRMSPPCNHKNDLRR